MPVPKSDVPRRVRLDGLDFLRGLCALSVVLGHVTLPPFDGGALGAMFRFLFQIVSNGPAAVTIFFVVSGLCIHMPQAGGRALHVPTFYSRRGLRIGIPMAAGWVLAWSFGAVGGYNGVLWSLVAEIIYYALYPLLRAAAARIGWNRLLLLSALGALALVLTDPRATDYPAFGLGFTWILGLPIWLLGCVMAESLHRKATRPDPIRLWGLRFGLFAASAIAIVVRWKLGPYAIGFPWSLSAFGVVAWLWLEQEIRSFGAGAPHRLLDQLGAGSYSLYLAHPVVVHTGWEWFGNHGGDGPLFRVSLVAASIVLAVVFFHVVEKPSHKLAKSIDLGRKSKAEVPT